MQSACRALGFAVKKKDVLAALERFDKDQQSQIDFDIFYQVPRFESTQKRVHDCVTAMQSLIM